MNLRSEYDAPDAMQLRTLKWQRQRGVALFVVLVFVLLSMLLALWASRSSLFNELVVGNDADYQRAFEAAQALIQDAELDIRGENADGTPCTPVGAAGDVCRKTSAALIPLEGKEVGPLLADLAVTPTRCKAGLCAKRIGRQDFWNYSNASGAPTPPASSDQGEVKVETLREVGARYGQYTGAATGSSATPINPILTESDDARGGWYWIEVLPYDESSKTSGLIVGGDANLLPLNLTPNVVYRITALAYGRRDSTMVVLQQSYAQQRRKD